MTKAVILTLGHHLRCIPARERIDVCVAHMCWNTWVGKDVAAVLSHGSPWKRLRRFQLTAASVCERLMAETETTSARALCVSPASSCGGSQPATKALSRTHGHPLRCLTALELVDACALDGGHRRLRGVLQRESPMCSCLMRRELQIDRRTLWSVGVFVFALRQHDLCIASV